MAARLIQPLRFRMLKRLFWDEVIHGKTSPFRRRIQCFLAEHQWRDIHRSVRPEYWVVDHQVCIRCDAKRPPPARAQ